ncbi:MAG: hypothetical protein HOQ00_03350 [Agromyces sp.]|nr:hypothetical protein [Agromyces sp.]
MSELAEDWSQFNVAMAGATAALAGLLIVAMSVNLKAIMASRSLPVRMATALTTLLVALAATALGLAPEQPAWAYGLEVFVGASLAAGFEVRAIRAIMHDQVVATMKRMAKSVAGTVPITSYLVGSLLLMTGSVAAGLWFFAAGAILAIASAVLHSWIVLVEVLR